MAWKRPRADEDFSEEIQAHLELETDRLVGEGMSAEEARLAARRRFGSVMTARERFYESGRLVWLDHLAQDLRSAARSVTKYPIASTIAIVSLAGGIGATTATLTVGNAIFWNPPPLYADPDQLSKVRVTTPETPAGLVPAPLYRAWTEDATLGTRVAAAAVGQPTDVRTSDHFDTITVRPVAPELFSVIGVDAALGRTFQATSTETADTTPAVLSHGVWQDLFDGRTDALGTVLWLDEQPHLVVGVMPEAFWFASMDSPIWTPLDVRSLAADDALDVLIRRPDGMSAAGLSDYLQNSVSPYVSQLPTRERELRVQVSDIRGTPLGGQIARYVVWLMAACVLLTLLIACTNVAVLMIAQWTTREHEIAIRASIGASRSRVLRLLLTESVLIAMLGGLLGVCATFALRGFLLYGLGAAGFYDLSIDVGILVRSAALAFAAGILAGIGPALYQTRRLHGNPLRMLASPDRVRQRWRHALVVFEITATVALLVVTGAMVSAYRDMLSPDLGFATDRLVTARVESKTDVHTERVLDLLNGLPGVAAAAATGAASGDLSGPQRVATDRAGASQTAAETALISPEYFRTLEVPLDAGRAFAQQDTSVTAPVAIVNGVLAERLWPGGEAVGSFLWMEDMAYQIVGVVADFSSSPFMAPQPTLYLPIAQHATDRYRVQFFIRATGDPAPMVETVRREVRSLGSDDVVAAASLFSQILDNGAQEILVTTYPMVPLVAIGMLLSAAGIYGVLAFAVTRRSRELALRVALGATRRDLLWLVTTHSLQLLVLGVTLGIGATYVLTRLAQGSGGIFDAAGWQAFVVPVLIVVLVSAAATCLPARRATRINPATLLRST